MISFSRLYKPCKNKNSSLVRAIADLKYALCNTVL
ncbi:hypothetical protein BCP6_089 [Bacillus phage BCP6]|nr:hypothetical protein BCP6_089 [Bacillus phage BCP6]